jgi:fused signal recognition particle receptor
MGLASPDRASLSSPEFHRNEREEPNVDTPPEGLDLRSERPERSLWRRIVDFALTDVNTIVEGGIDDGAVERLEQVLLEADFGVDAAMELIAQLERAAERGKIQGEEDLRALLGERIRAILTRGEDTMQTGRLRRGDGGLSVVLMVGVNGTGKTTTVAKLAHRLRSAGDRVLLAAADTFRAGAQEKLRIWAERVGADFVGGSAGGDPAAVAFDAVEAAQSRGAQWVLIDTAGRLHTQSNLMQELQKIDRVLGRKIEGAPHERLLVVDATTGQNVLNQARQFGAALDLSGMVFAKFDSTARAGTAVAVSRELAIPVRYLGTGEDLEDLVPFDPELYVRKLLGDA